MIEWTYSQGADVGFTYAPKSYFAINLSDIHKTPTLAFWVEPTDLPSNANNSSVLLFPIIRHHFPTSTQFLLMPYLAPFLL
jgi:hypothetical protein